MLHVQLVFRRTYARSKDDGRNEEWKDTVQRVVEGTFNMQQRWFVDRRLGFNFQLVSGLPWLFLNPKKFSSMVFCLFDV